MNLLKVYKNKAQNVQGNPSLGMKILGGLMITLGIIVVATCFALAIGGSFLPPVLLVETFVLPVAGTAGIGITAAGIGIFSGGMCAGLSKVMDQLAETIESANSPKLN